jgi:uncharacterized protein YciI
MDIPLGGHVRVQMDRRCWSLLVAAIIGSVAAVSAHAQAKVEDQKTPKETLRQYVVLLKHGPKWLPGKSVAEQPLLEHGKYLKALMDKGTLQWAGPFLDDSGGLVLLNAADDSEARRIAEHDPGVIAQILVPEIHPFRVAFDAATGKSPFQ